MYEGLVKSTLGDDWHRLAPAIRAHYEPLAGERLRYEGTMERVYHSLWAKLLIPFCRLVGGLVPYRGDDVPVTLWNWCTDSGDALLWERRFAFPNRKPYVFRSVMRADHRRTGQIIEFLRFGMGCRLAVTEENGGLVYRDRGYVWRLGRWLLWIPVAWLLGRAVIEERAISSDRISVSMTIVHPIFGTTFSYQGSVQFVKSETEP